MMEISFGVAAIFGLLWAFQLFVILEMLAVTRETRSQLHTAVRKLAEELKAIRDAHEAHIAGTESTAMISVSPRRRSTDVADWVVDSNLGNGLGAQRP